MTPPSPPDRIARHFWPTDPRSPLPAGAVYACGMRRAVPSFHTDTPGDVTCRRCVRSHLVQGLLRRGATLVRFDRAALELWGLIRR